MPYSAEPTSNCHVAGWGKTEAGRQSPVLLSTDVKVFSSAYCNGLLSRRYNERIDPDFQFCAGQLEDGKDSCFGDSGGPLFCVEDGRQVLYGIVSWGGKYCGNAAEPGVYSTVANVLPWIKNETKGTFIFFLATLLFLPIFVKYIETVQVVETVDNTETYKYDYLNIIDCLDITEGFNILHNPLYSTISKQSIILDNRKYMSQQAQPINKLALLIVLPQRFNTVAISPLLMSCIRKNYFGYSHDQFIMYHD